MSNSTIFILIVIVAIAAIFSLVIYSPADGRNTINRPLSKHLRPANKSLHRGDMTVVSLHRSGPREDEDSFGVR
jgi:hypothetical protein